MDEEAKQDYAQVVFTLIEAGADVDADYLSHKALVIVVKNVNAKIVRFLVQAEFNVNMAHWRETTLI